MRVPCSSAWARFSRVVVVVVVVVVVGASSSLLGGSVVVSARSPRTGSLSSRRGALRLRGGSDSTKAWSYGSRVSPRPGDQFGGSAPTRYGGRDDFASYEDDQRRRQEEEERRQQEVVEEFLSRDNRNSFVARVYAILTAQLLVTAASVWFFAARPETTIALFSSPRGRIVPALSSLISFVSVVWMGVSPRARTSSPLKWNLLAAFTLSESLLVGLLASLFPSRVVWTAAASTALATGAVTAHAVANRNAHRDLSSAGRTLASWGVLFLVYGALAALAPSWMPYNEAAYGLAGAALFAAYLSYHTKRIVSGEYDRTLSHKDYVYGAVTLYSDIVNMFVYLLRVLAATDDSD